MFTLYLSRGRHVYTLLIKEDDMFTLYLSRKNHVKERKVSENMSCIII